MNEKREIDGREYHIKRDVTQRTPKYYTFLESREIVWGGSVDIVARKVERLVKRVEIDDSKLRTIGFFPIDDIPTN